MAVPTELILDAIIERLQADATIAANVGSARAGTSDNGPAIFLERAPKDASVDPSTGATQNYCVLTHVGSDPNDLLANDGDAKDGEQITFDIHHWWNANESPYSASTAPAANLLHARIHDLLSGWAPTVPRFKWRGRAPRTSPTRGTGSGPIRFGRTRRRRPRPWQR